MKVLIKVFDDKKEQITQGVYSGLKCSVKGFEYLLEKQRAKTLTINILEN